MRKTFLKVSLLAVLGLGMSASFTGCKDYDGEIDRIDQQIAEMKAQIDKINALVSSGSVITSVSQNAEGVTFTLSNGQSYTVTNGKAGKDADVWTIVTNADGKLVWAKNGVATDFPAQGPAGTPGENGTAEPGIYYQPNEDGYFYKVDPAKGTSEKTPISWKSKGGALSAVATGDKVILSGIVDGEGNAAEDITIWRSMFIKSLVAVPGFYLDGIEATRYRVVEDETQNALATVTNANAVTTAGPTTNVVPGAPAGAEIAKGQPLSFKANAKANGDPIYWTYNEMATMTYHVNPSNAVTDGMKWNLIIDDKEVINRASNVSGEVLGATAVNGNGDITITYQLDDTDLLAPFNYETGENWDNNKKWTMMALQAANPQTDSALVASNNVAVVKRSVHFVHLLQSQNGSNGWVQTYDAAKVAIEQAANPATTVAKNVSTYDQPTDLALGYSPATAGVLTAAYNATYNLASHISIETSYLDNMTQIADGLQNDADQNNGGANKDKANTKTERITLATAKTKYGLTPKYQLVTYTNKNTSGTSEDKFAKINAETGVITPCYVESDGSQVEIPGSGKGTSAIGRAPLVYITLNAEDGSIVLAGFVKVMYTTASEVLPAISLSQTTLPYVCNNTIKSTWEQITGGVYEQLGLTPQQFSNNYKVDGTETPAGSGIYNAKMYVASGNGYAADDAFFRANAGAPATAALPSGYDGLGSLVWDSNTNGSQTQQLTLTMTWAQYAAWYATYSNNAISAISKGLVNKTQKTATVYAKFINAAENKTIYIGFDITLAGTPEVTYSGKLISQWTENLEVAPVNPAVPGQTTDATPVQKANGYPFASSIAMSFPSIWNGGKPAVAADAPYNFADKIGNNDNPNRIMKVNYRFAATQPSYAGYTITRGKRNSGNAADVHTLWAYKKINNKDVDQPIAVITGSDGSGSTAATLTGDAVWNVISMLPYYQLEGSNSVKTPAAATGELTYAQSACNIVNSAAFVRDEPAITFNVELVASYGVCELTLPAYGIQIGTGRPISLGETNTGSLKDAVNGSVLASKLFTMVDWQGHLLWNVNRSGAVTASQFNGVNLANFWFSVDETTLIPAVTGGVNFAGTIYPACPNYGDFGITIDLASAKVGNDPEETNNIGTFSDVYVDKKLTFSADKDIDISKDDVKFFDKDGNKIVNAADIKANAVKAVLKYYSDLDNISVEWTNNGSSVTSNIYVFVPVSVTYVWGQNVKLGSATITIQPTLSAE